MSDERLEHTDEEDIEENMTDDHDGGANTDATDSDSSADQVDDDDESSDDGTDDDENSDGETDDYSSDDNTSSEAESDDDDDESSSDDENIAPIWVKLKREAWTPKMQNEYEECYDAFLESGVSEKKAEIMAQKEIRSKLRKHVKDRYVKFLKRIALLRKDRAHKQIMSTKRKLLEEDEFDENEALHYAVKKRRFLIEKASGLLSDDEISNEDDDDDEEDV